MKKVLFIFMIISLLSCSKDEDKTKQVAGELLLHNLDSLHDEGLIGDKPSVIIDGKEKVYDLKSRNLNIGFPESELKAIYCFKREVVTKYHDSDAKDGLVMIFSNKGYENYVHNGALFFMNHKLVSSDDIKLMNKDDVESIVIDKEGSILSSSSSGEKILIISIKLK